jgi:hypothetical protein
MPVGEPAIPRLRLALAATMVTVAVGLWLSSGATSRAATTGGTQSVSATISSTISWGTAGTCIASTGAATFGSLAAGASSKAPGIGTYIGCVASNAIWGVTAKMDTEPSAGEDTIPAEAFRAEVLTVPLGAASAACPTGNSSASCSLDNSAVSLVSDAPATPLIGTILTNGFTYNYKLDVPSNQPAGSYSDGVITLTASN